MTKSVTFKEVLGGITTLASTWLIFSFMPLSKVGAPGYILAANALLFIWITDLADYGAADIRASLPMVCLRLGISALLILCGYLILSMLDRGWHTYAVLVALVLLYRAARHFWMKNLKLNEHNGA